MDSFGTGTSHKQSLAKDVLITASSKQTRPNNDLKKYIPEAKDSVSLNTKDFNQVLEAIKANKVTDISAIKDVATFKEVSKFDYNGLSDHQLSNVLEVIRYNISEKLAEVIFNAQHNDKLADISTKERALINNILLKVQQSQVTSLSQAIDFVQRHSEENPGLLSKISGSLLSVIQHNPQQNQFNQPKADSFTPSFSIDNRASNPFRSNHATRSNQPRTSEEAKEFLDQLINSKEKRNPNVNPQAVANMSNLILANYLRNSNKEMIPEEMVKACLKQVSNVDQMMFHNNILANNVSFINDVAAKIAANKAKTIINCRIIGEIAGSTVAALGMATIAGSCPFVGLIAAFALTLAAGVMGMVLGKALGEEIGKIITGTNLNMKPDDYENVIEDYQEPEGNQSHQGQEDSQEEPEETEAVAEEPKDNHAFGYIDTEVSEALKSRIIYRKK